jgi:hypothetical protein
MSDTEPGRRPLSEFATPVASGLEEDAETAGAPPFDAATAEQIRSRMREIDAAQQRAEATSRDFYLTW